MSDTHTTGANVDLNLADGTIYQMAPLSDVDISELDEWVRTRHIQMAVKATAEMSEEASNRVIEIATVQAASMTWMSGLGARLMSTVDGMSRLVWQSIKGNHPDVKEVDLRKKMFDPRNVEEANRIFARVNPKGKASKAKGRVGGKAKKDRKRRRTERLRKRMGGRGRK